jgi:hypothetical protein
MFSGIRLSNNESKHCAKLRCVVTNIIKETGESCSLAHFLSLSSVENCEKNHSVLNKHQNVCPYLGRIVEPGEKKEPLVLGKGHNVLLQGQMVRLVGQEVVHQAFSHLSAKHKR